MPDTCQPSFLEKNILVLFPLLSMSRQEGGSREPQAGHAHLDLWRKWWSNSPWEVFPGTGRWSRGHCMDLPEGCCAWPTQKTFCGEMTGLVDEGTAVDIVYLDFSKAFDTVSITAEQIEVGVNQETGDRLKGMVCGTKSKWRPLTGSNPVQHPH